MKVINLNAWNKEIAIVAMVEQEILVNLEDIKYSVFSPLAFEENLQAKEKVARDGTISSIGLIADSIAGAYGKAYFDRYHFNTEGTLPSLIERLSFIGSDGLGALEFSPSTDTKLNDDLTFELHEFKKITKEVYEGNVSHRLATLVAKSNSGAGGAKAKAVLQYNPTTKKLYLSNINAPRVDGYEKVIMKFNSAQKKEEIQEYNKELKCEYVYYLLALEAGLNISKSWLEVDRDENYYFLTARFDVKQNDERFHMHSLAGILGHDASSFTLGYETLFRVGNMLNLSASDKLQMFKNMVFNIVFANKDDHSRNFSFLMDTQFNWQFSPSYDLTYAASNYGVSWHQLTIDKKPITQLRSLSIIKIAKLCSVKNPLEIFMQMIELKERRLKELCKSYRIESMSEMIFEDTKEIDKVFRKKR